MPTKTIVSNDGHLNSASAVLLLKATNPQYNQPVLHIDQASADGAAASIRIDDPNPDIEFVEKGEATPAGKYEIAVQSDTFQINGRRNDDHGFQTIALFHRMATGGNIGLRVDHTFDFAGGQGVIAIGNAAEAPSGKPVGGGLLYVEDGALKYRGSHGTVTVIAPA
jgi:hypothetical protein